MANHPWAKAALPIPSYCKDRPLFKGMVIPFVTFIASDGTPDFRINDPAKVAKAVLDRLCGICGRNLGSRVFFIGGEKSTKHGTFLDPPMHELCARYAASICPFLVGATDYSDIATRSTTKDGTPVGRLEGTVTDRTAMFFTCSRTYTYELVSEQTILFTVVADWTEKFWGETHATVT